MIVGVQFETDVMTAEKAERLFDDGYWYFPDDASRNDFGIGANIFCSKGVKDRGWKLGKKVILVFTTVPTRGASRCRLDDLHRAGLRAFERLPQIERNFVMTKGKLWWWPENVYCAATAEKDRR